jgi:hypothetical protein
MRKLSVIFLVVLLLSFFLFSDENGKRKFQIELYGGFSVIDPADLNSRPLGHKESQLFWGKSYYDHLLSAGYINSYNFSGEGDFKTIKQALPLGFRLKYLLNRSWALSLGLQYVSKSRDSNVRNQFNVIEKNGEATAFFDEFSPLTISAKGFIPKLGIHFERKLSKTFGIEAFLAGGPLFGHCRFDIEYFEESQYNGTVTEQYNWLVMEKGKGIGYAFEGGLRINIYTKGKFGFFVEGGYALQKVRKLNGPGEETANSQFTEWDGDWGMKEHYRVRYWGTLDTTIASNYWQGDDLYLWVRGFELDLSGFQMRIGFTFSFGG